MELPFGLHEEQYYWPYLGLHLWLHTQESVPKLGIHLQLHLVARFRSYKLRWGLDFGLHKRSFGLRFKLGCGSLSGAHYDLGCRLGYSQHFGLGFALHFLRQGSWPTWLAQCPVMLQRCYHCQPHLAQATQDQACYGA